MGIREHDQQALQAALEAGLTRYTSGKPCKHGHFDRRTYDRQCVECTKTADRRRYKAHPTVRVVPPVGYFEGKVHRKCGTTLKLGRADGSTSCALCARLAQARQAASERRPIDFEVAWLRERYIAQAGLCFYCDCKLVYTHNTAMPDSLSLDRLDSTENYTTRNTVLACHNCNSVKSSSTVDDLERMAKRIRNRV